MFFYYQWNCIMIKFYIFFRLPNQTQHEIPYFHNYNISLRKTSINLLALWSWYFIFPMKFHYIFYNFQECQFIKLSHWTLGLLLIAITPFLWKLSTVGPTFSITLCPFYSLKINYFFWDYIHPSYLPPLFAYFVT